MTQTDLTLTSAPTTKVYNKNSRALPLGLIWTMLALAAIVLLAAGLRLIETDSFADGNTYYTAAVKNMLNSPRNFFFATADAGGVTVDKPPVALWIQAIFAAVLGVSGFSVILPSILAGIGSVLLIYHLVQKQFGASAGLIAAFVLAITPISVAVDRTNNLDSILIFTLLLATWAFVRAVETGKWRHLLLGAVIVGVAFNVKMLQAYLILPTLVAFYFLGAAVPWRPKIVQLIVAGIVVLAVSLSWALAVELIPEDQRPYIGGSEDNSVIELALGYNGLERILGDDNAPGGGNSGAPRDDANALTSGGTVTSDGGFPVGAPPIDSSNAANRPAFQPPNGAPPGGANGGPGGNDEIGEKGVTRLFESALANELSWLLPFALLSIGVLLISRRINLPIQDEHQALVLWGGWLTTGVIFFSVSSFFHAYYLATIAPALAAMVGIGTVSVWKIMTQHRNVGISIALLLLLATLLTQAYILDLYDVMSVSYMAPVVVSLIALVIVVSLALAEDAQTWLGWAAIPFLAAILVIPSLWGAATATNNNLTLPAAYTGVRADNSFSRQAEPNNTNPTAILQAIIEENTADTTYDLVVNSSMNGSQIILDSDLDVLFLGGFNGQDQIYSVEDFASMVAAGDISFVLASGTQAEISTWVSNNCIVVENLSPERGRTVASGMPGSPPAQDGGQAPLGMNPGSMGNDTLYNCAIE